MMTWSTSRCELFELHAVLCRTLGSKAGDFAGKQDQVHSLHTMLLRGDVALEPFMFRFIFAMALTT